MLIAREVFSSASHLKGCSEPSVQLALKCTAAVIATVAVIWHLVLCSRLCH